MTTIEEACGCGATLHVDSSDAATIATDWRRDHSCGHRRSGRGARPPGRQPRTPEEASAAFERNVQRVVAALDQQHLPANVGRPGARLVLRAANVTAKNDVLGEAIRRRRAR